MDMLKNEQHRSSTKRNYRNIWKNFNQFCICLDIKPDSWEDRISLYAGYLVSSNKQSSMVKSYVSAIKGVLEMSGIKVNEDRCLLSSLTRACRLVNDKVRARLPIQRSMLVTILNKLGDIFHDQPFLYTLFTALFSTAYFGLFRVGELTKSEHAVRADDVQIGVNKNKVRFVLRSSKTHGRHSLPQIIKISSTRLENEKPLGHHGKVWYCPYQLLWNYLQARPLKRTENEQFFVFSDGSPVTPDHFRKCLKMVLTKTNYNPTLFSSHSFRIGRGWRRRTRAVNSHKPYLYDYYNVFGYYTTRSSGNRRAIGTVLNSLIVGLNTRDRLPRLIVLVLDKDIIEDVCIYNNPSLAAEVLEDNVTWLFKQIETHIRRKQIELTDKKPGAVYGNDPKIIVVEMLDRLLRFLGSSTMAGILELRSSFNQLLNDAAGYFGLNRNLIEWAISPMMVCMTFGRRLTHSLSNLMYTKLSFCPESAKGTKLITESTAQRGIHVVITTNNSRTI